MNVCAAGVNSALFEEEDLRNNRESRHPTAWKQLQSITMSGVYTLWRENSQNGLSLQGHAAALYLQAILACSMLI